VGSGVSVVCVDKKEPNGFLQKPSNYRFIRHDLADGVSHEIATLTGITDVIHFAAQSHVDTSIQFPRDTFVNNVLATQSVLGYARVNDLRFLHISTDEVFGSLEADAPAFTVDSQYQPNSPYAASKAACDHLVRSYRQTYGLRATTLNCSNNFGPGQDQEKLIPKTIWSLMRKNPIEVYGTGENVRDWIHVSDFCSLIWTILSSKAQEPSFVVGANDPWSNNQLVEFIVQEYEALSGYRGLRRLIHHIYDRPGHDFRYHVDNRDTCRRFNWKPNKTMIVDLRATVRWYLDNATWFTR